MLNSSTAIRAESQLKAIGFHGWNYHHYHRPNFLNAAEMKFS